jgi:mannonate dehydratase
MRVGLTLSGDLLNEDGARFAAQLGVGDVVVHLTDYRRGVDEAWRAGAVGPPAGDCAGQKLWSYEEFSGLVGMLARHGLRLAALENFSPNFWADVLLDGPQKRAQIEGLKRLVRDAGRAGVPVIGYNFSIAGVWGWTRRRAARGDAATTVFDLAEIDPNEPIPDGMVWNMRYRPERAGALPVGVSDEELWDRLAFFLRELLPVAEEAGVALAAHPDDPPAERLRGTARLVNSPEKYDRLLSLVESPANMLEFCIGSLAEMPGHDIYGTTRRFARAGKIAYVHFRNVSGQVPRYRETFVDDGDVDMAEIVRILRDEGFGGVMVPDHVPELDCPAPWHAGHAFTVGYMRALVANAPFSRREKVSPPGSGLRPTRGQAAPTDEGDRRRRFGGQLAAPASPHPAAPRPPSPSGRRDRAPPFAASG